MSLSIHVAMKHTNKGTRMLMYVAFQGTAQIPLGKAKNQPQNEFQQACIRHQAQAIYVNTAAQISLVEV